MDDNLISYNLVRDFFGGDTKKTELWFKTENPLFGWISPIEMIRLGRIEKVRQLIESSLDGNFP